MFEIADFRHIAAGVAPIFATAIGAAVPSLGRWSGNPGTGADFCSGRFLLGPNG